MAILHIPQPGDKIIITDQDILRKYNAKQIVVNKPLCGKFFGPNGFDFIWIKPESHIWIWLRPDQYKI